MHQITLFARMQEASTRLDYSLFTEIISYFYLLNHIIIIWILVIIKKTEFGIDIFYPFCKCLDSTNICHIWFQWKV